MIFRQLAKDSIIYGGADLLGKLIAFFTFPVVAAVLSPKAFGALEVILTTASLIGLLINCGLSNSVQRFYWDSDVEPDKRPLIVSTGFYIIVLFGVICFIIGAPIVLLISSKYSDFSLKLSVIGLFSALLFVLFNQWQSYIIDVIRLHFAPFKFLTVSLLSRVLAAFFAMLAVVWLQKGIDGYLAIQSIVLMTIIPLSLFFIKKDLVLAFDFRWAIKLVRFGYPFIFAGLAYWLFGSMDRWMLTTMSSLDETGIYSVAFRFASVVLFVSTAFGMAWSPIAIKVKSDNPDRYKEIYAQVLLLLVYIMLIVGGGVSLFSGEILYFLMPGSYAASSLPLTILCFGIVLQTTQQVTAIGISLEKKTFIFARLAWITAGINFILNWLFVPRFGACGSASATLISYFILTGSYLFFTQKLHPLPIQWKALICLLLLGLLVFIASIVLNEVTFNFKKVSVKIIISLLCMYLGWRMIPVKSLSFSDE